MTSQVVDGLHRSGQTAAMADDATTQMLHDLAPFTALLGVAVERADPGEVVGSATWAADRCTTGGVLHGGYLMALADSIGALCAVQNLPAGATTSTIESKTNFFRGVTGGSVSIVAVPLHVGRTTIVVQTDISRDDGKPVARITQTQAVLSPR